MRTRGVAAAVAGLVGAVAAHALDRAGLLPGVHETAAVREAMGPALTACWLLVAGGASCLAAATRPAVVGPLSALLVAGVPELVGRADPGAVLEPGALAGALLQSLLLLATLALAVVTDRWLRALCPPTFSCVRVVPSPAERRRGFARDVDRRSRPRAPPVSPLAHCH